MYDPQINRSYAEFAEHYGTFINACIPGYPKGKAKVERQVQEGTRTVFVVFLLCICHFSLQELNKEAQKWCRSEYGKKPHRVQITDGDFPEDLTAMMDGQYPHYLVTQAAAYGPGARNDWLKRSCGRMLFSMRGERWALLM